MNKLLFTQSAQKDLVRLREFIAEKNLAAARRISQKLKVSILKLVDQPDMGVNVDELPGIQDLIAGDYRVRYSLIDKHLYILRIWHGKEDR